MHVTKCNEFVMKIQADIDAEEARQLAIKYYKPLLLLLDVFTFSLALSLSLLYRSFFSLM